MKLNGKVAIITGATGGIGEATAKLFLQEGAKVVLVGRSEAKLAHTCERLGPSPALMYRVADAADEKANAAAVDAALAAYGGLDIMIANAGTEGTIKPLEEQSVADFEDVLRTNVLGVWLAMKACVAPMKKRGGGSIVAISSVAGVIGFANMIPYIASKHAVIGMVKTAALELASANIRVNAVGPGPIANRMMQSLASQMAPDDPTGMSETLRNLVPMKRYGTNEEVANLVAFLACDDSSYCTGGIHMIDGGFTAP